MNDSPVGCQSRALARPQAGSPRWSTKNRQTGRRLVCLFFAVFRRLEPTDTKREAFLSEAERAAKPGAERQAPPGFESPLEHQTETPTVKVGVFVWYLWKGDSKGAGVNDSPVGCQSRAPARPQAGSPRWSTRKKQPCGCFFQ